MAGRKPPIANTEPRLGGLRIQTSLYGQTIPVAFGRCRIPLNLVWFGGFKATRQEEQSEAAKGGGSRPSRIYYSYSAHVLGLLGEGPITAVRTVYKGKQRFTGQTIPATASSVSIMATVPGVAPYQINVGASWTADVGVAQTAPPDAYPPWDAPLVPGVHYTVAGGVYTFNAEFATSPVSITYTTTTAASSVDALGQIGLALVPGTPGQPTWQLLVQQFAGEALPYSGFAYVRGQDYPLTSAAEVENHGFEVDGFLGATANGDAWPRDVIREVLTNPNFSGAQWSASRLGDWTAFHAYCQAYGLAISPAFLEQRATRDWLQDILDSLNTDAAWTGSVLKLIPRGDENAGSYVAPTTPVFNLGPDDFLADDGELPLRLLRSGRSDAHNVVRVEFANRARDYNLEIQPAEDEASIITFGRREESAQAWHWFADGAAARQAAFLRLQRKQAVRAQWEGRLPWRFAELEPGDLVTLTDPSHFLTLWPVRVLSIEENGDDFDCVFEDFPIGHATAPIVPPQLGSGFRPDFNAPPGNVVAPMIFEPPGGYTQNGLEVWAAVSGPAGTPGQFWGGAEVYASLDDGASYKLIGRVDQGARFGTLSAALAAGSAATLSVTLAGRGGQLRSVSSAEADALATLMFIGSTATGEFIAFDTAALTGPNAYNLQGLRRGRFSTTDQAAPSGTSVVLIDGALAMSGPLPNEMIGRTIRFKFCSFNVFGGGLQQLADVVEYSYTITGRFRDRAAAVVSANWIENASCFNGIDGWSIGPGVNANAFVKHSSTTTGLMPAYVLAGTPADKGSGLFMQELGDRPANGVTDFWVAQPGKIYPVIPGERIEGSVFLCTHRCTTDVRIAYYRLDGTYLTEAVLWGPGSVNNESWLQTLSQYGRRGGFSTVPANAVRAMLFVRKYGRNSGIVSEHSYVFCTRFYMGPALPGQTELSPWTDGPTRVVGTSDLERDAATGILRATFPAQALPALNGSASVRYVMLERQFTFETGGWALLTFDSSVSWTASSTTSTAANQDSRAYMVFYALGHNPLRGESAANAVMQDGESAFNQRTYGVAVAPGSYRGSAVATVEFEVDPGEVVTVRAVIQVDNTTAAQLDFARLRVEHVKR